MAIFNSYIKLPEGRSMVDIQNYSTEQPTKFSLRGHHHTINLQVPRVIPVGMWVKQCHLHHPPVITIFISCMLRYVYHFQMAGLLLFYLHTYIWLVVSTPLKKIISWDHENHPFIDSSSIVNHPAYIYPIIQKKMEDHIKHYIVQKKWNWYVYI